MEAEEDRIVSSTFHKRGAETYRNVDPSKLRELGFGEKAMEKALKTLKEKEVHVMSLDTEDKPVKRIRWNEEKGQNFCKVLK